MRDVDEAALDEIELTCDFASPVASLASVYDVLAALTAGVERPLELLPDGLDADILRAVDKLRSDPSRLFRSVPIDSSALGTGEIVLQPSDWYLDLVAAIARRDDVSFDADSHVWPILSVVARTNTVAGRGRVTSPAPEGRP